MTKNQLEFKKQQNRLKRAIKRAEKQGYFDFNFEIPELPKRVTKKSLEEIKAIKPKHIIKEAQHVDFETGWVRPAQQVIVEKKEIAKQKRKQTIERKRVKEKAIQDSSTVSGDRNEPTLPTLSTITTIENRLNQLANNPRFQGNMAGQKVRTLLDIFHHKINHPENDNQAKKYRQYINEHIDDIAENSLILEFSSSDSVEFDASLNNLIEILNGGEPLSVTQALTLGEMSDYI